VDVNDRSKQKGKTFYGIESKPTPVGSSKSFFDRGGACVYVYTTHNPKTSNTTKKNITQSVT